MKTGKVLFLQIPFWLVTLSSAFDPPTTRPRNLEEFGDRKLQSSWASGFCEGLLQQCYDTVGSQKNAFPWPEIDELLSGILGGCKSENEWECESTYDYIIEDARQSIANLAAADFANIAVSFEALAGQNDPTALEELQHAALQLKGLNPFDNFPNGVFDAFLEVTSAVLNGINLLLPSDINVETVITSLNGLLQVFRDIAVPPVRALGIVSAVGAGLLTFVNAIFPFATEEDSNGYDYDYDNESDSTTAFCPAPLIACSLEMLTRYLVTTVSETVLSLVPTGDDEEQWSDDYY